MQLIYTSKNGAWLGVQERYSLDLSFGADDNDFELTLGLLDARRMMDEGFDCGCSIFVPETEYGGIIDYKAVSYQGSSPRMTFKGRTWHGVLAASIIEPDKGMSHLTLTGDANEIIQEIVTRQGLGEVFAVDTEKTVTTTFKFPRYVDAYKGIRRMLESEGLKLRITKGQGKCLLGAVPVGDYTNGIDNNYFDLSIDYTALPVNHLVCLGKGVGAARAVVNLYADRLGNVSQKQSLFGIEEISEVYNYNSLEAKELTEKGIEKLKDYQKQGNIDIDVTSEQDLNIGDILRGVSVDIPIAVVTTISQVIVRIGFNKPVSIQYKAGTDDPVEVYE